jgi:hypothetical protein
VGCREPPRVAQRDTVAESASFLGPRIAARPASGFHAVSTSSAESLPLEVHHAAAVVFPAADAARILFVSAPNVDVLRYNALRGAAVGPPLEPGTRPVP